MTTMKFGDVDTADIAATLAEAERRDHWLGAPTERGTWLCRLDQVTGFDGPGLPLALADANAKVGGLGVLSVDPPSRTILAVNGWEARWLVDDNMSAGGEWLGSEHVNLDGTEG